MDPGRPSDANIPPAEAAETAPYVHASAPADLPREIGRFLPREVLGQGTFGTVYRAWDPQLQREVALKVPRGEDAGGADRLLEEARAASHLKHPGIVAVYEAGRFGDGGAVYIASEFVTGVTLSDQLRRGAVPPREAARVVR